MLQSLKVTDEEPKPAIGLYEQIGANSLKKNKGNLPNSNVIINKDRVQLTEQRLCQFLKVAEEITDGYYDDEGRLDVMGLVKKYKFTVGSCDDPIEYLKGKSRKLKYKAVLKGIAYKREQINGFSFPQERKIFYNSSCSANISEGQIQFAIIHELSHYLLGHKGKVFYKTSSEPKSLELLLYYFDNLHKTFSIYDEPMIYSEEADRLTAILLMPIKYMQKHINDSVEIIAKIFVVIEKAVEKRKKEVIEEMALLPL
jgi:hypothetical protein